MAPNDSAISTVRSVEPVSTMIISSTTSCDRVEAARKHLLLVLHDHRQADAQPLGGPGPRGDALHAARQRRQRERHLRRQLGGHVDPLAPAARQLVEVAAHVRQVGVQPARGLEQSSARLQHAQLVQQHAHVVEQHGLAWLLLEDARSRGAPREQQRRQLPGLHVAHRGQRALDQGGAGAEAAMRVRLTGGVGEQHPVAVQVALREIGACEGGQLGGRAAHGLRCGSCGQSESHTGYLPSGRSPE